MTDRAVRWRGALAATVLFAVVGVAARSGALVLAGLVPLAAVAHGLASGRPDPTLAATRRIEPSPVPPGHPIRVRLTVTNEGDRALGDVRVVDGVPTDLAVTEGTPRAATTLDPGESVTLSYELVARRGDHAFDPPRARVRNASATRVVTRSLDVAGDRAVRCRLDATAPPLEERGRRFGGHLDSDSPGRGLAFHSVRDYRMGDDAARIDWRHYAKRGELATVNYERPVTASVAVVLDAREPCRVVAGPGRPTAVELGAYAATHAVSTLLDAGQEVAVAVLGAEGVDWLAPGSGPDHRSRAIERLRAALDADGRATEGDAGPGNDDASDGEPVDWNGPADGNGSTAENGAGEADRAARELLELLAPGAQVALFSPLLDDRPVELVGTWRAGDRPTVVLAPDVLSENTVSGQLAGAQRGARLARCQALGARVVDWRRGTPLPVALECAFAGTAAGTVRRVASGDGG